MYVDVIPLLRLPYPLGVFTYRLKGDRTGDVQRGVFVRVPFRHRSLWAIVVRAPADAPPESKRIRTILALRDDLRLTDLEVGAIERTAALARVSPATVAYLTAPLPPARPVMSIPPHTTKRTPRTGARGVAAHWVTEFLRSAGDTIAVYHDHRQRLDAIAAVVTAVIERRRSILVLTPHRAWLPPLTAAIRAHAPLVLLDRTAARSDAWADAVAARQSGSIILATRVGAFTAPPSLGAIVLDEAEHDDCKERDAEPRYDSRTVTAWTAASLRIPRLLISVAPRVVEWTAAHHRLDLGASPAARGSTVVDLTAFWRGGGCGFLTPELLDAVRAAIAGDRVALILHNRRGRMGRIVCRDCDRVIPCARCGASVSETDVGVSCRACGVTGDFPLACPACASPHLLGRGIGTVGIAALLARMFPDHRIARVDRDAPTAPPTNTDIIVASERFTTSIAPTFDRPVGVVIVLHAERFIRGDDYRGSERLLQALRAASAWAQTWRCSLLVQTSAPTQPAMRALVGSLTAFYRAELEERAALRFPPTTRLVRCSVPTLLRDDAVASRALLHAAFRGTLESADGPYTSQRPRHGERTNFLLRLHPDARDEDIAAGVAQIPRAWAIDVDPVSLHG